MNRLESGYPVEDIIFLILCDGVYRHSIATKALLEDGGLQNNASCSRYFDTMEENLDALYDAFIVAVTSPHPKMKQVMEKLNVYIEITEKILENGIFACALTDEEIIQMTSEAGQALNLALDYSTECIEMPEFLDEEP